MPQGKGYPDGSNNPMTNRGHGKTMAKKRTKSGDMPKPTMNRPLSDKETRTGGHVGPTTNR
jgi:hypothetical protein